MTESRGRFDFRRLVPWRRDEPDLPPLRDFEVDPARAPRRNDLVVAFAGSLVPAASFFWSAYRGPDDDLGWAIAGTLVLGGFLMALGYGLARATLRTAHRRKAETFSNRYKVGFALAVGVAVGGITFLGWRSARGGLPSEALAIATLVGLLATVAALAAFSFLVDVPAYEDVHRTTADRSSWNIWAARK
jgi:hypothetical protein